VVLDLRIHGVGKDPWGNTRAGFTATAKVNRKDFGLGWNQALETGQLLVGEDVDITLDIEGIAEEGQASQAGG
jgi:polyisoprenoid-binding protein YceI